MDFTGERFIPLATLLDDEIYFEHLHRYHAAAGLSKDKVVLDIACGEGYGSAILAKTASRVIGIDIDAASITHAQEHYSNEKTSFQTGSANNIPLPDHSVDVVISYETIEHLDEPTQEIFLGEIRRVLTTSGVLIMSTPDKVNYTERYAHKNEFHIKEFSKQEYSSFLQKHFEFITTFLQGYEVVDAITPEHPSETTELVVTDWDRKKIPFSRKYMIAVCSNAPLSTNLQYSSVVFQVNKNFLDIMDGLVDKEKHILELGAWGKSLDKEIAEKNIFIQRQNTRADELDRNLQSLRAAFAAEESANNDKSNIIAEQKEKMHNLYTQLEGLQNRLNEIYVSDGWKWLNRYYNIKGRLLPEDSKGYRFLKNTVNTLRGKKGDAPYQPIDTHISLQQAEPIDYREIEFTKFDKPVVSIIIPVFNGWMMTYKCLAAIKKHTVGTSYEIIVADDGATDETKDLGNLIKNVTVIRNETNLGFLNNCNNAALAANGKYILFLNNDTEPRQGWLSPLVDNMDNDESIGMSGSKLIYPNGHLQEAGGIIWNDASGWNYGHDKNPEAPEYNYVKDVDYISGAAIIIRRTVWEEIGGFDQRYAPAYYEDTDLAFAVREKGYRVVYQPLSEVTHFEGFSNGKDERDATSIKAYQEINKKKFFEKWKLLLTRDQFANGENVFWARDRTAGKKTIVVVDHYVPHYDKDAGSRHTFQYLKLFVSLQLNVKFIGDNYYKHEPYTTTLQQLGIEVLYGEHYRLHWKEWVLENGPKIDYVLLNRPHIAMNYIDYFREHTQAKIIFFGHDLHFHREEKQYQVEKTPALLASSKEWKKTETYLFTKSDIIATPSAEEQRIIKSISGDFNVSVTPLYYFNTVSQPIVNFTERSNLLFVGGFNHKPNVDAVRWFVKDIFPQLRERLPGIKLIIVGSNAPVEINSLATADIIVKGFLSEEKLEEVYATSKITVIPLRYGAGVKGKTLEALHKGVPVVTTSFGIEGLPGDYSFLIPQDNANDFITETVRLYSLPDHELTNFSAKEIAYIEQHFSENHTRDTMIKLLGLPAKTDQ